MLNGRIFTVSGEQVFCEKVARFVLSEVAKLESSKATNLADVTVIVPSSRAVQAMQDAFLKAFRKDDQAGGILPQIKSLSLGEDDIDLLLAESEIPTDLADLKATSGFSRLLVLSELVLAKLKAESGDGSSSEGGDSSNNSQVKKASQVAYSTAMERAEALASLYSRFVTYGVNLDDLQEQIPDNLASHWQSNLEFLKIVFGVYPQWLANNRQIDSNQLAVKAVLAKAENYAKSEMKNLTVLAGFSDTTPAGLELIRSILSYEKGVLFMPSLDLEMSEKLFSTEQLAVTHYQYTMAKMLEELEVNRSEVASYESDNDSVVSTNIFSHRSQMWKQVFYPRDKYNSENPEAQNEASFKFDEAKAIAGMSLLEASNSQEEAEAIAIIMRESLEDEARTRTCALVTPDRELAKRVQACLTRWEINVDDSAGSKLIASPLGQLFYKTVSVISKKMLPLEVAGLVKHPFAKFGSEHLEWKKLSLSLENTLLRGVTPESYLRGLKQKSQELKLDKYVNQHQLEQADVAIEKIALSLKPLLNLSGEQPLAVWIKAHIASLKLVLSGEGGCHTAGSEALNENGNAVATDNDLFSRFSPEEKEGLLSVLNSWQEACQTTSNDKLNLYQYVNTLNYLLDKKVLRKRHSTHPRLFIWGSVESRMQEVDRVIIAGANEGLWPRKSKIDPWLNRQIAKTVGLPDSDLHVGMNAHDFVVLGCKKEVFITRAKRDSSGATIESRYLTRLKSVLSPQAVAELYKRGAGSARLSVSSVTDKSIKAVTKASANPSKELRPKRWSASLVKDLMQCPYKVHVAKILKLKKLDDFNQGIDASDKGQLIHTCLEAFYKTPEGIILSADNIMPVPYSGDLSDKEAVYTHLILIGEAMFKDVAEGLTKIIWWDRYTEIANKFASITNQFSYDLRKCIEVEKELCLELTDDIMLTARVDRIDDSSDGLTILDYKTGTPPSKSKVFEGKEPQLLVEALLGRELLKARGNGEIHSVEYWHLHGKKDNGIEVKLSISDEILADAIKHTEAGIAKLVKYFISDEGAMEAVPSMKNRFESKVSGHCGYCDYQGICRVKEWV